MKIIAEAHNAFEANILEKLTPFFVVKSVTLTTDSILDGGSVQVTVRARSNAPVNWINCSLYGPNNQNIYGGGHGTTFYEVMDDIWEYRWTDTISPWQPSGVYTYRNISVSNEGKVSSAPWKDITFSVFNQDSLEPVLFMPLLRAAIDED